MTDTIPFSDTQDLAVRREGVFILRYRAFDLCSGVPGNPHAPVLAELYGGPFKVYSTREFPGLDPSTDLTKVRLLALLCGKADRRHVAERAWPSTACGSRFETQRESRRGGVRNND